MKRTSNMAKAFLGGILLIVFPLVGQAAAQPIAWQQSLSGTGDVWSIAIGPGGVVFAATLTGVYRSTDNGGTWTRVAPGVYEMGTNASALAINPFDDSVFLGRSAIAHGAIPNPGGGGGSGLYRSTDNGGNWTYWNVGNAGVFGIGITSSGSVIAGSSNGLYTSTDNGANWAFVGCCHPRSFANTSNGDIFAGDTYFSPPVAPTPTEGGVLRSTDGGGTWTQVGLANTPIYSLATTASDHLFAGSASTGIFRSTDGVTWTQVHGGLTNPVTSLAVSSAGEVFAGVFGDGVLSSSDDGQTWTQRSTGLTDLRVAALAISPSGFIFAGTPSGVFRTGPSTWIMLSPAGGLPPERLFHTAVYNATTNRMVIFAGIISTSPGSPESAGANDVWVLVGANGLGPAPPSWVELGPFGASPSARGGHTAVYDQATNRMIVFGGREEGFPWPLFNDVWVLTNADGTGGGAPEWILLAPEGGPPAGRAYHRAVYDATTNRMIVFGGQTAGGLANDVWVLTNASGTEATPPAWVPLAPDGTPPVARSGPAATYDPLNHRMTIFGGAGPLGMLNDTWVLTNADGLGGTPTWTPLSPAGALPAPRFGVAVYDTALNRLVIFGGNQQFGPDLPYMIDDTWVLLNANGLGGAPAWQQSFPAGTAPPGRRLHSEVYDQASNRMVVFGGQDPALYRSNGTWVLTEAAGIAISAPPVANAGPDQSIHAGQTVVLNGGGSFDDNTPTGNLIFAWAFVSKPEGSSAFLTGAGTDTPTFVADVPGDYVVSLTVRDGDGLSSTPDTVLISSLNAAPTANAGPDQGTFVGNAVTLDGSGSQDPDGDLLGFSWTLATPGGSGATLSDETTAFPSFTPDVPGAYTATLTVEDGLGGVASDSVQVSVISEAEYAGIVSALNQVGALPSGYVTTQGNQQALQNLITQAIAALQAGDLAEARNKLTQAIGRTDGCALRGTPDGSGPGRDWVTDCGAQAELYSELMAALDALGP